MGTTFSHLVTDGPLLVAAAVAMRALDVVSKVFLLSGLAIGASLWRVYRAHRPAAPR